MYPGLSTFLTYSVLFIWYVDSSLFTLRRFCFLLDSGVEGVEDIFRFSCHDIV